jgi:hypothetical protein
MKKPVRRTFHAIRNHDDYILAGNAADTISNALRHPGRDMRCVHMRSDRVTFCGNQKINKVCTYWINKHRKTAVKAAFMGTYSLISVEQRRLTRKKIRIFPTASYFPQYFPQKQEAG